MTFPEFSETQFRVRVENFVKGRGPLWKDKETSNENTVPRISGRITEKNVSRVPY